MNMGRYLPKSQISKAYFPFLVTSSLLGAIGLRLFPDIQWLYVGGGLVAVTTAIGIGEDEIQSDSLKDTVLFLLVICPVILLSGLLFYYFGLTVFDLGLYLVGWERSGDGIGQY